MFILNLKQIFSTKITFMIIFTKLYPVFYKNYLNGNKQKFVTLLMNLLMRLSK